MYTCMCMYICNRDKCSKYLYEALFCHNIALVIIDATLMLYVTITKNKWEVPKISTTN